MTGTFRSWLIGLILIGLSGFASAEFYRYVDKEGKVHYTDNLANVPADQRRTVDQFEDVYPELTLEEETEAKLPEGDIEASQESDIKETLEAGEEDLEAWEQRLNATGARLREEYDALMQKKEELRETSQKALTPPEREAVNEATRDLNRQIEDYEQRRQVFDKEAKAYNASIEKGTQPPEPEADEE